MPITRKPNLPVSPSLPTSPKPHLPGLGDGPALTFFNKLPSSPSAGSNSAVSMSPSSPSGSSSSAGSSVAGNTGRHDPVAPPLPPVRLPTRAGAIRRPAGGGVNTQERSHFWNDPSYNKGEK